jgi:hypothetical protein
MGVTPASDKPVGDTSPGVPLGNATQGNNSKARADAGLAYEAVDHPTGVRDLGDTINMWAYYLNFWCEAARDDIKDLEARVAALEKIAATTQGETHLDPPPDPPYDPAPT